MAFVPDKIELAQAEVLGITPELYQRIINQVKLSDRRCLICGGRVNLDDAVKPEINFKRRGK